MLQVCRALYYAVILSEEAPLDKDVVKVQRMKLGFLGLFPSSSHSCTSVVAWQSGRFSKTHFRLAT